MVEHSGGCQCGAIRYKICEQLGEAVICHCRMCQKAFGSWGAALVDAPLQHFTWTRGEPAIFKSSPVVSRGFCKDCGTPLFMREDGDSNIELAIGTLDNPNAVEKFQSQDGMESRVNWFNGLHNLPPRNTVETRPWEILHKLKSLQHPDHDTEIWPPKPTRP
jgi:hypothetical protein